MSLLSGTVILFAIVMSCCLKKFGLVSPSPGAHGAAKGLATNAHISQSRISVERSAAKLLPGL